MNLDFPMCVFRDMYVKFKIDYKLKFVFIALHSSCVSINYRNELCGLYTLYTVFSTHVVLDEAFLGMCNDF